jgi:hypothetical protein
VNTIDRVKEMIGEDNEPLNGGPFESIHLSGQSHMPIYDATNPNKVSLPERTMSQDCLKSPEQVKKTNLERKR